MEMLLKLNLYPSENSCIGKLVNNWGMFRRIGAPRKRICHDHQEVRAAHNPVRLPRGVGDVARRTPRDFGRTVAQARQERLRIRDGLISRSPRRRPVYGWIDSRADSFDDQHWLLRFTPHRPRSKWSQVNRLKVGKLIEEGRMKPAGLREVKRAKADGRWEE